MTAVLRVVHVEGPKYKATGDKVESLGEAPESEALSLSACFMEASYAYNGFKLHCIWVGGHNMQ